MIRWPASAWLRCMRILVLGLDLCKWHAKAFCSGGEDCSSLHGWQAPIKDDLCFFWSKKLNLPGSTKKMQTFSMTTLPFWVLCSRGSHEYADRRHHKHMCLPSKCCCSTISFSTYQKVRVSYSLRNWSGVWGEESALLHQEAARNDDQLAEGLSISPNFFCKCSILVAVAVAVAVVVVLVVVGVIVMVDGCWHAVIWYLPAWKLCSSSVTI